MKAGILHRSAVTIALMFIAPTTETCSAQTTNSYFWPESGSVASPTLGSDAVAFFRACPNNDGGSSLFNNARIKITVLDQNQNPVSGVSASDIVLAFNGGTAAQGFSGVGADSVIANGQWNQSPLCPNLQIINADAPTDANGVTYITFAGSTPGSPGVATRDPNRKWGHYDSILSVFLLPTGAVLNEKLTPTSAIGTYTLRIKSFDHFGGLAAVMDQGEKVDISDYNTVANNLGVNNALSYWRDFDSNGVVDGTDLNMLVAHYNHDCGSPNSP